MDRDRLTPTEFHILLSLADADRHGLGVVEEVEKRTGGEVVLGPGLLYSSLKRLAEAGLVAETEAPAGADPRRRYYRITRDGRVAARAEAERWARTLEGARDKQLLDERVSG